MGPSAPPPNYNVQTDSAYHYIPTKSVCIIFLVMFLLSGLIHAFQAFYFRKHWLLATAFLACVGETIGWAARYRSSLNYGTESTPFLIQISTTIISPTFLLAVYFTLFGRIIFNLGPQYSREQCPNSQRDILCLVLQALGGGMASGATDPSQGAHLMLGGIVVQLVTNTSPVALITFNVLGAEFLWRCYNEKPLRDATSATSPEASSRSNASLQSSNVEKEEVNLSYSYGRLKAVIIGVVISNICLMIRGIYRTAELSDGFNGRIISTEVYFNLFDGAMVVLATFSLNILHPGYLLPWAI
ncbi:hypothetical protein BD410DRAFT_807545 [Rickenella mellea]|uniref:RTA1 like protein n=1 Tax=Rickenella mellea TaxID=50990 RepID=A0A4Y7PRI1_9AGAM|nr:hypothetical protein BD410DRAFT_807545 [Rickenella mellea]